MKPKFFYDKLFRVNFWIFYKWDYKSYENYLSKEFGLNKDLSDYHGSFEVVQKRNNRLHLIWVSDTTKEPMLDLAHECVHAANFVMNNAGVIADFNNDELQAYYVRMLIKECL